jgi:predicted phosphodiesterase
VPDDLNDALKATRSKKRIAEDLKESIAEVEHAGYIVQKPAPPLDVHEFDSSKVRGERVRLALISDTHLGSKQQQLTHLRTFASYCKKKKIDAVLHCGDVTDGPPQMHPGHLHNLFLQTYDAQRQYAVENLPDFGIPSYYISGNHDESWLKNNAGPIVPDICKERGFTFVGQSAGYVRFGKVLVYMHHPHDGQGYALSYKLQNKIRDLSPEAKPNIFLAGNYHKACHLPGYRNVEGFLLPSYQAQTPFMVSKGLPSIVGGIILEFGIISKGLASSVVVVWILEREMIDHDW